MNNLNNNNLNENFRFAKHALTPISNDKLHGTQAERENRYKIIIQNINEYIYSVDYNDGNFISTYHSPKCLNITGYTPDEYRTNPDLWFLMIYEEDCDRVNQFLHKVLLGHKSETIDHRIIHKDNSIRWVSNTCAPEIDSSGRIIRLNGFILDITSRKNAQERQSLALKILDLLNESEVNQDIIHNIIHSLKVSFGIEVIGLRLKNENDFPDKIFEIKKIPLIERICNDVIVGNINTELPFYTNQGSFWTNCASELSASLYFHDLQANNSNQGNTGGYESMALIPLKSKNEIIGILQFNDSRKGIFTPDVISFFEKIGSSIGIAILRKQTEDALRISEEKVRARNELIEKDLKLAQKIQSFILPKQTVKHDRFRIEYRYFPHDTIGGDFFSFAPFPEGIGIFIGDVVGHGISAALFISLLKAATDRVCRKHGNSPKEYLNSLNVELIDYMNYNFLTAIYGLLQFDDQNNNPVFRYSNAGHPKPILHKRQTGQTMLLKPSGTMLGVFPDMMYPENSVSLNTGDRIFLYTDGLPETKNEKNEIFGFDNVPDLISAAIKPDLSDTLNAIISDIYSFKGSQDIEDDLILIGIEIL